MNDNVIIWDLETVSDQVACVESFQDSQIVDRQFPKLVHHSIVCIGVLVVCRRNSGWETVCFAAPTSNNATEPELIEWFDGALNRLKPKMVTFNGNSFDLPVLRYRALKHGLSCAGLCRRNYFHRYTDEHVDLCDVLASYNSWGKISLDELSKAIGLPGKPDKMDGSKVEGLYREGRVDLIANTVSLIC